MKDYVYILALFMAGLLYLPVLAQERTGGDMLVVINGEIASNDSLNSIPEEEIKSMHYLSPGKAGNLYGPAGAHGALLVKVQADTSLAPIVLKEGERLPADSLQGTTFRRIDVLRGRQALNLYGPAGKKGVIVVHPAKERFNSLVEVVNAKGRPVRGAAIKNEYGTTVALTNTCGLAYLENLLLKDNISVSHKNYQTENIEIADKKVKIVLELEK